MCFTKSYTSWVLLSIAAVLMFGLPTPAGGQPDEDHQPISIKDNAALWYWVAFSEAEGVDHSKLYHYWPPIINTDNVRSVLVEKRSTIVTLLHRGASQPACAWGVDRKLDGVMTLLTHLALARRSTRLAGVRAEYYFQQGEIDLAVDDLVTALTLGRHVSVDGSLMEVLVQMSISRLAQEVLVKNLYRLDRAQLLRLQEKLADLPPRQTVAQAFTEEKGSVDWMENRVLEGGIESLRDVLGKGVLSPKEYEYLVEKSGGTVEGFGRLAEQMRGYYDQSRHIATLGYDEVDHATEELLKQIEGDDHPMAQTLPPGASKARQSELRHEAQTTMLHAMIAYQLGGPEALARITDPYDGKPFEIEVDAKKPSVVLRSRMPHKGGDPISVKFPGIEMPESSDQP